MESGWDPQIRKYFTRILNTVSLGLLWLLGLAMAGIYYQLGFVRDGWHWENFVFYGLALITGILLFLYFYRIWKNG